MASGWSLRVVDARTNERICDAEYVLARDGFYIGRRVMNPALCSVGTAESGTFEIVFAKPGYVTKKVSFEIQDDGCHVTTNEVPPVFLEPVQ